MAKAPRGPQPRAHSPKGQKPGQPKAGKPKAATARPAAQKEANQQADAPPARDYKKPGAHERDEKLAKLVELSAAIGYTQEQAARLIGVAVETMLKHYRLEWEQGGDRVNAAIAANLASIASSGRDKMAVTAAIFWLKTRAGWKDTSVSVAVNQPKAGSDGPTMFTFNFGSPVPGVKGD